MIELKSKMGEEFQVTFKGFKTLEEAKEFAYWYSGSGEQNITEWLSEHTNISSANTKEIKLKENGNVIVNLDIIYE